MYGISLDRTSSLPLVRQLCDALRSRVLAGTIPAGTQIPSSRTAAAELGIARNVVIESYEQLEAEGFLTGVTGSGTRVTELASRLKKTPNQSSKRSEGRTENTNPAPRTPAKKNGIGTIRTPVIDFATASGTPDLATFPFRNWKRCIDKTLDAIGYADLSFTDIHGDLSLRQELAALLFRTRGIQCEPDQLFVTKGTTHSLSLVAQFLRKRTARATLEDPLLNSFKRILTAAGYTLSYVPVDENGLQTDQLQASTEPYLSIVTPSHQFPSGGILPIARRLELLERVRESCGWIFEDDYDGEIRLRGVPIPPILTLDRERVFYAGTFNKTLYPAIRTGFLIVPEAMASAFASFRLGHADWPDGITGRALALFIREGLYERHIWNLRKLYRARRDALIEGIAEQFGDTVSVHGTEAGCHCRLSFKDPAKVPGDWNAALSEGVQVATVARYLHERNERLAPKSPFSRDIILGYGNLDEESIATGLRALRKFMQHVQEGHVYL